MRCYLLLSDVLTYSLTERPPVHFTGQQPSHITANHRAFGVADHCDTVNGSDPSTIGLALR